MQSNNDQYHPGLPEFFSTAKAVYVTSVQGAIVMEHEEDHGSCNMQDHGSWTVNLG